MSLIKNSSYNIAGFVVPTIIAIPALGILARQLGVENFGLFTLAFAIIGYASIFDGGISRAVIREIAVFREDKHEQKRIISTASVLVIFLGIFSSVVLFFGSPFLVDFINVSDINSQNAQFSFKLLALIVPFFLINQVWLSFLEGHEEFANINIQRVISSVLIFLFPLMFCMHEENLFFAISGLVLARICSFILTLIICRKIIFESGLVFDNKVFKRFVKFGGWLTVSNVISPIMVYFDRFLISNIMGASKVAFYTAPAEAIARLTNIPSALSRALFPRLSFTTDTIEKKKLEKISYLIVSLICLPITIFCYFFSETILTIWLGVEYSGVAALVFQILLVGFYFNAVAQIPYSILQARGNSKITALIHIAEIIPYIILLYTLTEEMGVYGTAIAWTLRCTMDFILMLFFSRKIYF